MGLRFKLGLKVDLGEFDNGSISISKILSASSSLGDPGERPKPRTASDERVDLTGREADLGNDFVE